HVGAAMMNTKNNKEVARQAGQLDNDIIDALNRFGEELGPAADKESLPFFTQPYIDTCLKRMIDDLKVKLSTAQHILAQYREEHEVLQGVFKKKVKEHDMQLKDVLARVKVLREKFRLDGETSRELDAIIEVAEKGVRQ